MLISIMEVAAAYLIQYRYRKQDWAGSASDSYYKPYETHVGGTNFWSLANSVNSLAKIFVFAAAFVT